MRRPAGISMRPPRDNRRGTLGRLGAMNLVTFDERKELAESRETASGNEAVRKAKSGYARWHPWNILNRTPPLRCDSSSFLSFFYRGEKRSCSVSGFKLYGIKLPIILGVLCLFLSSLSEIFLLPVLLIGLYLNWSIQMYLYDSEIRPKLQYGTWNKEVSK